jgi:hypothetical protein
MYSNFTYQEYKQILNRLKKNNKNLTFSDFKIKNHDKKKFFILRHDIDYSLENALSIAKIENKLLIRSTFFFLLTSPFYNLFSKRGSQILRTIKNLNHEIGLHYDVSVMEKSKNYNIKDEVDILSNLASKKVVSIAMHNPSIYGKDPFSNDKNFINAYDKKFTKNINYYSDSCGAWRDKTYNFLNSKSMPAKIQFLIHPIFWSPLKGDRVSRFNKFLNQKTNELNLEKKYISKIWDKHSGVKEHIMRNKK